MKIIYNKLIPIRGYLVINIFGTFFVRKRKDGSNPKLSDITINHELIHTSQMKEMLYVFFYIWYFIEWLVRLITNTNSAYYSISLEREAYINSTNIEYLNNRKHFSWLKYLRIKNKN